MPTGTLGTAARDYHTRQTTYLMSPVLSEASGGNFTTATVTLKIGTIPAGASIVRVAMFTNIASNAGTSGLASVGTAASGSNIVAVTGFSMGTVGVVNATIVAASSVPVLLAADTDIYVTNVSTGTAATAGNHQIGVEYLL